jgi:hypothetical protein
MTIHYQVALMVVCLITSLLGYELYLIAAKSGMKPLNTLNFFLVSISACTLTQAALPMTT